MGARRLHYIDWLRVLAVLLLLPFHTARVFDADDFYVKGAESPGLLDDLIAFVDAWHMPLLFFLAGASTYFALRKRTARQYSGERGRRLLVPLVFGVLVLIPPQTWYGGRFNSAYPDSYLHYIASGDFLESNIREGGDYYGGLGLGHLWFIAFLLAISLIALPLWRRTERGERVRGRASRFLALPVGWLAAGLLIVLAEGLPALAGKNLFYYFVFFGLGYLAMCSEQFMAAAERWRWATLAAGVGGVVWWTLSAGFRNDLADPSLGLFVVNLAGMTARWLLIVGLLGTGRHLLDRTSPTLRYLAEGSYAVYILHQTVIVVLAFYIVGWGVTWPLQWLVLLGAATAGTFLAYEGVRRIGWLRSLFGMRPLAEGRRVSRPGDVASSGLAGQH